MGHEGGMVSLLIAVSRNFCQTCPKTTPERIESSDSLSGRPRAGERRRAHHSSPYGQAQVHHEAAAASPSVAVGGSWELVIAAVAQQDCRLRPDVFARKPARCC